ncbi:twin-arginine translocase TatA/TatE family subunit [Ktedonobacter racemifer]|uniref:Sec-independent translocation protein mttA/Hcf106 n=1 Tax=Ktedonobacter racemifer DSM 44963 TaxID=485913 RepID=D6TJV7_KTERA|nr:twin-arginine translocase TatA/TatE family subunit [Ktedonobacter racemifer]EFH89714.1 hypothetical protein Krac_11280 [Ktedonobacter racemifer DSM 44963]
MGFHPLELAVLAVVVLAIFGPKTLSSFMHGAGKTMGQAKQAKDKFMAEVPVEDFSKLKDQVNAVSNPGKAVQKLLLEEKKAE